MLPALQLLEVVRRENADAGLLVATGGFAPTLVELHAKLKTQHLHLRGRAQFLQWLEVWERTFASPLFTPMDPLDLIALQG